MCRADAEEVADDGVGREVSEHQPQRRQRVARGGECVATAIACA